MPTNSRNETLLFDKQQNAAGDAFGGRHGSFGPVPSHLPGAHLANAGQSTLNKPSPTKNNINFISYNNPVINMVVPRGSPVNQTGFID